MVWTYKSQRHIHCFQDISVWNIEVQLYFHGWCTCDIMYWQYAKCTVFSNPWNHGWTLNFNYWVLNLLYIWIILHEGNLILTVYYFENNNKTLISCFEPLNHIKFQVSFFFRSPCWLSVHLPSYLLHSYFTFLTLRTTQPISIKLATSFLETKEQKVAKLLHIIKVH